MRSQFVYSGDRAYHIGVAPGELARQMFLVGDPARARRVAERFDRVDHEARHREYVTFTGLFEGMPVSVMGTGIGTDNVEIALVEAYGLLEFSAETGTRLPGERGPVTVVRIGTSGGTREDLAPGTLAITSLALGLDSTGLYYEAPVDEALTALVTEAREALVGGASGGRERLHPYGARADAGLVASLCAAAGPLPHAVGITAALPGFYAASGRFIDGLPCLIPDIKSRLAGLTSGDLALINVEMESSLLLLICGKLGWPASTICPILSTPSGHGTYADPTLAVEQAITVALRAVHDRWSAQDGPS